MPPSSLGTGASPSHTHTTYYCVWKKMVGAPVNKGDLEAVDKFSVQSLNYIANIHKEGVTAETFEFKSEARQLLHLMIYFFLCLIVVKFNTYFIFVVFLQ